MDKQDATKEVVRQPQHRKIESMGETVDTQSKEDLVRFDNRRESKCNLSTRKQGNLGKECYSRYTVSPV